MEAQASVGSFLLTVLIRGINVASNIVGALCAGLMFGYMVCFAFVTPPLVTVTATLLITGSLDTILVERVLFTVFSGSIVTCYWMLIVTVFDKRYGPPFSLLGLEDGRVRFIFLKTSTER